MRKEHKAYELAIAARHPDRKAVAPVDDPHIHIDTEGFRQALVDRPVVPTSPSCGWPRRC